MTEWFVKWIRCGGIRSGGKKSRDMARPKVHLKRGMGGSSSGRGRSEKTGVLKTASNKARRWESKQTTREG